MRLIVNTVLSNAQIREKGLSPEITQWHALATIIRDEKFSTLLTLQRTDGDAAAISSLMDFMRIVPISTSKASSGEELSAEFGLLEMLEELPGRFSLMDWPRELRAGNRESEYEATCGVLAPLANEIEILDPWLGEKLVNHQRQLWLVNRLMRDCDGSIRIITREPKAYADSRFGDQLVERQLQDAVETFIASVGNPSVRYVEVDFKRYTDASRFVHNRAIRFLFSNGVSSDHVLEHGVEAFGRQRIEESDLSRMSAESFGQRRARVSGFSTRFKLTWDATEDR